MGSQRCRFLTVVSFFETWGEPRKQSSWLREAPAAQEAAGNSFLGVVELNAKLRSLSTIVISWLESQSDRFLSEL